MKKLLAVFAHPDDETFGPGGTLAKYAQNGVCVHVLSATRGESGNKKEVGVKRKIDLGEVREKELKEAAKILGISKVEFLGFKDGELKQNNYHKLVNKIVDKIREFKPELIVTYEERGISGHLDHIAVSLTTTYAYLKTNIAKKLYYYVLPEFLRVEELNDYFIYFPDGYPKDKITTTIDVDCCWKTRITAMRAHKSQMGDVRRILKRWERLPKKEYFVLKYHKLKKVKLPEKDLLNGIN